MVNLVLLDSVRMQQSQYCAISDSWINRKCMEKMLSLRKTPCVDQTQVDWLIDWLVSWWIDWSIDWLMDGWIGWVADWLIDWWMDWWVADGLSGWWIGWVADWLIDRAWSIFSLDLFCFFRQILNSSHVFLCDFCSLFHAVHRNQHHQSTIQGPTEISAVEGSLRRWCLHRAGSPGATDGYYANVRQFLHTFGARTAGLGKADPGTDSRATPAVSRWGLVPVLPGR